MVTTGGSVKEVIGLVENLGSSVVAVGSIIDRSNGEADFKCPFENILKVNVESFDADECIMTGSALISREVEKYKKVIYAL